MLFVGLDKNDIWKVIAILKPSIHILTYHSKDVWDAVNIVLLACSRPEIQEIMDIYFELLQINFRDVWYMVFQVIQCSQLEVWDHTPILIKTPYDTSSKSSQR